MDKPVKEIKSKSEIRRFFNNKIVNSEKVVIDGKTMYMTVICEKEIFSSKSE